MLIQLENAKNLYIRGLEDAALKEAQEIICVPHILNTVQEFQIKKKNLKCFCRFF